MSVIKHTELFDFPAYESEIKQIKQLSTDFGKTMDGILSRLSKQQKALVADLKQYEQLLKGFNTSSGGASSGLKGLNNDISGTIRGMTELQAVSKGAASILHLHKASVTELKAEYNGIKRQMEALRPEQANYNVEMDRLKKRLSEVTPKVREFNTATKASQGVLKSAEGSYRAMQTQLGQLRTRLRDIPNAFDQVTGKMNKNNKEAVALQREINKLDIVVKQADKSMGIYYRNVGNYSSAISGFKSNIVSYATQLLSLTAVFGVLKSSLDVSKRFEALNSAIAAVSDSSADLANNQEFLRVEANKFGQDIFVLANSFKSLTAATNGTKLEGAQTRKIFESVVQAGTALKLSNEQVEGTLLALQQMISKGNVQAEELRGQLGERLPGAFRIFAQSMGKSEQELNKMLQNGEVLAVETLPKFAEALAAAYPVDGATALVNEQNRLNNAWNEFLNSKKVTAFWGEVTRGLTTFISDFNFWLNSDDAKFFDLVTNTGKGRTKVTDLREAEEKKAAERQKNISDFQTKNLTDRNTQLVEAQVKYNEILKRERQVEDQRTKAVTLSAQQRFIAQKNAIANEKKTAGEWLTLLQDTHTKQSKIELMPDPADPLGQKRSDAALAKFKQRIADEQALLKKGYDLDVVMAELAVAEKKMTEENFQIKKFELSNTYAGAAMTVELKLGKSASKAKLTELKMFLIDAERERLEAEEKVLNKLRSKSRTGIGTADQSQFQPGISITTAEGGTKKVGFTPGKESDVASSVAKLPDFAEIEKRRLDAQVDAENKAFDIIRAGRDTTFKEELAHLERLKKIKIDNHKSTAEEQYAIDVLLAERRRALNEGVEQLIFQAAQQLLDSLQESANAKFEKRIDQLETEKQQQMEAVGSNAAARENIEKSFNKKIATEKRKQAQSNKRNALFEVGLNTGVGVTKSIAQWGMPWAIPFIALTIASGLIQAAAIAAKPIPEFKIGTKGKHNAPKGPVKIAEAGPELSEKNGKFKLYTEPQYANMQGGERIYNSNETTKKLAEDAFKQEEMNKMVQESMLAKAMSVEIARSRRADEINKLAIALGKTGLTEAAVQRAFTTALDGLPIEINRFDERGYTRSIKSKNDTTTYLNSRHG